MLADDSSYRPHVRLDSLASRASDIKGDTGEEFGGDQCSDGEEEPIECKA